MVNNLYHLNECIQYMDKLGNIISGEQKAGSLKCVKWRKDSLSLNQNTFLRINGRRK